MFSLPMFVHYYELKSFLNCIDLFTNKYTLYTMDGQVYNTSL